MKRMLINATQEEEMRVALVNGQHLYDLDIENIANRQKKSNIYKGTITRVEPSLEACFVNYGVERHGFLPFKEIAREYLAESNNQNAPLKDLIKEGTEVIVQVERDERGNKGAALTTYVSLAGRYLVLMPNNPRAGGVSRRISGKNRADLREQMEDLEVPEGMGLIVRTAGMGRVAEELQWDLNYLVMLWEAIQNASKEPAPFLIFQESNIIVRALRDYYRGDIGEILVDNEEVYKEAENFIDNIMPQIRDKIKLYKDNIPLFTRFQVESQIQTAYQRDVKLPSGGALVFDYTEALVSIDINSGRSTKGADIEETALNTNLEAAEEIARQLKLRDLGGLIVIDFIDMIETKHQREVENRFHDALASDRARIQVGQISRFGLLEMSRQRLRASLDETSHISCPRCDGQGTIRNTKSLALAILRLIEEECLKEKTAEIIVQVPIDIAIYLLNEKRDDMLDIETRLETRVIIIPNKEMDTPHFNITRYRTNDSGTIGQDSSTHVVVEEVTTEDLRNKALNLNRQILSAPAVTGIKPTTPPPTEVREGAEKPTVLQTIISFLKDLFDKKEEKSGKKEAKKGDNAKEDGKNKRRNQQNERRNNRRNNNNANRNRNVRMSPNRNNTIETVERNVDQKAEFIPAEENQAQDNNRRDNRRDNRNDERNDNRNQRQNRRDRQDNQNRQERNDARSERGDNQKGERQDNRSNRQDRDNRNDNRNDNRQNQNERRNRRDDRRDDRQEGESRDNDRRNERNDRNEERQERDNRNDNRQNNRRNRQNDRNNEANEQESNANAPQKTERKGEVIVDVNGEKRTRKIRDGRPRIEETEAQAPETKGADKAPVEAVKETANEAPKADTPKAEDKAANANAEAPQANAADNAKKDDESRGNQERNRRPRQNRNERQERPQAEEKAVNAEKAETAEPAKTEAPKAETAKTEVKTEESSPAVKESSSKADTTKEVKAAEKKVDANDANADKSAQKPAQTNEKAPSAEPSQSDAPEAKSSSHDERTPEHAEKPAQNAETPENSKPQQ